MAETLKFREKVFNPKIAELAARGLNSPRSLAPDEVQVICEATLEAYTAVNVTHAGVYLILVDGASSDQIPALSRKDAMQGWLAEHGYETLKQAADTLGVEVDDISVTELLS